MADVVAGAVRVRNLTRAVDLADRASLADTFWRRLRGLLGRASLDPGEGLAIAPCSSVHTIGMRFVIDAVYLDRDGTVLRVVPDLGPGRLGPHVWGARTVVELPAGRAAATGTAVGDRLEIAPAA